VEEKSHGSSAIQKVKEPKMWAFENASERTMWVASVDARHTRAESTEGKGETMVGAKEIATLIKKKRYTSKTCGRQRCKTDCTLLSE
jgi:hypothetical protein